MVLHRRFHSPAAPWALALVLLVTTAAVADADPAAGGVLAPAASAFTLAPMTMDERSLVAALAQDAPAPAVAPDPDLPDAPVASAPSPALSGLKSLLIPGWGQLATGHKTQAAIFLGLEVASWASWLTFQRQGRLREQSYIDTARLYAGIDLSDQAENIRRYVGQYQSEEVYNQYVVRREAAFFIEDPAEQAAYIAENSLGGEQSWHWNLYEDFVRYGDQRRSSEAAYHNSEFVVGFAIVNRLVSGIMAVRQASSRQKARAAAGAAAPVDAAEPVATAIPGQPDGRLEWGVEPSLNGPLEGRVGWTVTF